MSVRALVHRKTRDLVRDAAEDVLRRTIPSVASIDRAEEWAFDVDVDGAEAESTIRRLLDETTLVVNPNVHRYSLDQRGGATPDGRIRVTVLVHDRVDAKGAAVLRAIRERRGITAVTGVRRSIRWTFDVTGPREEAEAVARSVTGDDGRGAGLLANRHSQTVAVHLESA